MTDAIRIQKMNTLLKMFTSEGYPPYVEHSSFGYVFWHRPGLMIAVTREIEDMETTVNDFTTGVQANA